MACHKESKESREVFGEAAAQKSKTRVSAVKVLVTGLLNPLIFWTGEHIKYCLLLQAFRENGAREMANPLEMSFSSISLSCLKT